MAWELKKEIGSKLGSLEALILDVLGTSYKICMFHVVVEMTSSS